MESFVKKLSEVGLEGHEKLIKDRDLVSNCNANRSFTRFANWFVKNIGTNMVLSDAELQEYDKLRKLEVTMHDRELLRSEVVKARAQLLRQQLENKQKREENERLKSQLNDLRREKESAEIVLETLKNENEKQFVSLAELNSAEQSAHQRIRAYQEETFVRNEKLNESVQQIESVIAKVHITYTTEFDGESDNSSRQFLAAQRLDILFDEIDSNLRAVTHFVNDRFYNGNFGGKLAKSGSTKCAIVIGESEGEGDQRETNHEINRVLELNAELQRLKTAIAVSYNAHLFTRRREVALEAQCSLAKERLAKLLGTASSNESLPISLDEVTLERRHDEATADCSSLRARIGEHDSYMHSLVREFAEAKVLEPIRVDYEAKRRAQRSALTSHRFVFERLVRVRCVLESMLFLLERERLFHRDVAKLVGEAHDCLSRLESRYASRLAAFSESIQAGVNPQLSTNERSDFEAKRPPNNADAVGEVVASNALEENDSPQADDEDQQIDDALKRLETILFATEVDRPWRLRLAGETQVEKLAKMTKSLERCVCELVSQFDERRADERVRKARAVFSNFALRNETALSALCTCQAKPDDA